MNIASRPIAPIGRLPKTEGAGSVGAVAPIRISPNSKLRRTVADLAEPQTFKKGGKVRKSGWAKVHKGEIVSAAGRVMGGKKKKTRKRRRPLKRQKHH
jgi:hypothetical protein